MVSEMIKECEEITGYSFEELKKQNKKRDLFEARSYFYKRLYEDEQITLMAIGKLFDRHYSSVLSGINKINALIDTKQIHFDEPVE